MKKICALALAAVLLISSVFSAIAAEKRVARLSLVPPEKTEYFVGEALDLTGMRLTALFEDGSSQDVTAQASIEGDTSEAGKKFITLSYAGLSAAFSVTVRMPENAVKLSVNTENVKNGTTVRVPLMLDSVCGLSALSVKIISDSAAVLTSVENGGLFSEGEMSFGGDTLIFAKRGGVCESSGTLAYLSFTLSDGAEAGEYSVEPGVIQALDASLDELSSSSQSGMLPLYRSRYLPGDANDNGELDIRDATAIQLKLVGIAPDSFDEAAADADFSGELSVKDVTRIQKVLVGSYSDALYKAYRYAR